MPKIERHFTGGMDQDTDAFRIAANDWSEAINVTLDSKGVGLDMVLTNINGNQQISYSLPAGTNKVIGKYGDSVRNRLYYFVYNSNGNNLVLYYDATFAIVRKVLISKTDTGGVDILNFDQSNLITSVNIIYRDAGDLLFFIDSLGRPTEMNVAKFEEVSYTNIVRSYIDLAKIPPSMPIKPVYENDADITQNNLKSQLFKFKYRWVYDTNEKSTWSSGSIVPTPYEPNDQDITTDKTNNARINLYFSTGNETVTGIEIAVSQNLSAGASDYQSVTLLKKADLSIANNIVSNFLFYNDSVYPTVDVREIELRQDDVPRTANAMDFPNGNVAALAGITEGYDLVKGIFTGASALTTISDTISGMLFFASQDDTDSYGSSSTIIIRLRGVGSNTAGVPTTILNANGAIFYVQAVLQNGTVKNFSYTSSTTSIATILGGLLTAATAQGFTGSVSGTTLTITQANIILITSYYEQDFANITNYLNNITYSRLPQCAYTDGIVYENEKGVTNGVVTTVDLNINTPTLDVTNLKEYPFVTVTINNRPPLWAKWYRPVRTPQLSYNKQLFWVSRQAFSNIATGTSNPYPIAYIDIGNMQFFNDQIMSTSGHVSYEFEQGDRIRFQAVYAVDGTITALSTNLDYEIVGVQTDFNLNGVMKTGRFIKIQYPTNQISSTFKFDGSNDFQNYKIFIYSARKSTSNLQNVYYESGVRFPIGNAGTINAYHIGNRVTQTSDLGTPATNKFYYGDEFLRWRNTPAGNTYQELASEIGFDSYSSLQIDVTDTPVVTGSYTIETQARRAVDNTIGGYPTPTDSGWFIQNTSGSAEIFVQLTGMLPIYDDNSDQNAFSMWYIITNSPPPLTTKYFGKIIQNTPVKFNTVEFVPFDVTLPLLHGAKLWLAVNPEGTPGANSLHIPSFTLTVNVIQNIEQEIVDTSFSDVVEIDINSNDSTRPDIIDINAKSEYYPATLRHGQAYQDNTSTNNVNRFYPEDLEDYDRRYMDIIRLHVRGSYMKVYQRLKVGDVPIFIQIIQDTVNNPLQAQTDKLLNKIHYYEADQGLGFSPASLAWSSGADYFVNDIKGTVCRLAQDGIIIISLYKMNAFFTDKLQYFRTDLNDPYIVNGGNPQVLGVFDPYTNKYIVALEEINRYSEIPPEPLVFHQDAYTLAFAEGTNRWESFYSYAPEMMAVLNTQLFTFKSGNIWYHNSPTYCNFYGTQYACSITLVFNDASSFKKTFISLMETGTITWLAPEITTSSISFGTTKQQSKLIAKDFRTLESTYNASLLRDQNSIGGILNGDLLKGEYIIIKLQVNEDKTANLVSLNTAAVKFIESQYNIR